MVGAVRTFLVCGFAFVCLSGCGGDDGPSLAEGGGTVKYKGKPLAGASVVFTPDEGPVAVGTTDAEGKFVLSTHGEPGAVIGPHKVAVTAFEPSKVPEGEATEEGENKAKSLIPTKFNNYRTSNLTATVSENTAENVFTLDLKD